MKLKIIEADPAQAHWKSFCGVSPVVLGVWVVDENVEDEIFQHEAIANRKETANIWMTIERGKNLFPVLRTVYCLGYRFQPSSEVLFYSHPTLRTPYTLDPLVLDVSFKDTSKKEKAKDLSAVIQKNLRIHTAFTNSATKSPESKIEMQSIINQMNVSQELVTHLKSTILPLVLATHLSPPMAMQAGDETSASADESGSLDAASSSDGHESETSEEETPLPDNQATVAQNIPLPKKKGPSLWLWAFMAITYCFRLWSEFVFSIVGFRIHFGRYWALRDFCATAVQVHLRLKQACSWPINYILVKQHWTTDLTKALAVEINLYNSIWLVLNDIVLGTLLGIWMYYHIPVFLEFLSDYVEYYTMDRVSELVSWLMGWPSGIKLNNNLDNFLGQMFLMFTGWWRVLNFLVRPYLPMILQVISCCGIFGATIIVALLQDLIALLFFNVFVFYLISSTMYHWQLGVLSSLFHLFKGQKKNILRNRVDSCDYSVEQLLLGTLLFTLIFLLLPTVAVYYVVFSGVFFLLPLFISPLHLMLTKSVVV